MSKYIRLTRKVIEDMFTECNRLYFNNEVERPEKFETWTPGKKILGMVRPVWRGKKRGYGSIFHISRRYRWTNETLRHVVVHEMIHLKIEDYKTPLTWYQRLPLIGGLFITQHDDRFIALMNELNRSHGLNIAVRFKQMRSEFIR